MSLSRKEAADSEKDCAKNSQVYLKVLVTLLIRECQNLLVLKIKILRVFR